ncbi:hypothetical protein TL16_g01087 [Triparma laevis f. inornata]|uniref:Uncharacterized protein n=1 Tax=Triparma laevis f. inornata TaxID=1714386 RepID=A0A9W6ZCI5_9STRA|nr:hypothetical protein TL16_g01087 [Triparma laevis f. inornata]
MPKLTWAQTAALLYTESLLPGSNVSRRCPIKVLDTAFLELKGGDVRDEVKVVGWVYTSKKGEITKKKKEHLSLTKVYERFTRFALANPENASTNKYVAVVHPRGLGRRRIMEHSSLQSSAEGNEMEGSPMLVDCSALQCYLRPQDGVDHLYRSTFDGENVTVCVVRDVVRDGVGVEEGIKITMMNEDLVEELKRNAIKLKTHIEAAMAGGKKGPQRVMSLTADFVLDDNRQLWLCCVDNVSVMPTSSTSSSDELEEKKLTSPSRPSLPSLDASETNRPTSKTNGRSIFVKRGSGSNAVWVCNKGIHELIGLSCWSNTHDDGTHSIRMQTLLEKWAGNDPLRGPPDPHQNMEKEQRSKERYKVSYKSVLLAQESEEFLRGNIKAESGAGLASKWRKADRACQSSLSAKKSYYDEITVDGNCYQICLKLDALRSSDFEIGGPASPVPQHGIKYENRPMSEGDGGVSKRKNKKANKTGGLNSPPSSAGSSKRSVPSREAFVEPKNLKKANKVYMAADPRSKKGREKAQQGKKMKDMTAPVDPVELQKFMLQKDSPTHRQQQQQRIVQDNENAHASRIDAMLKKKRIEKDMHERTAVARAMDEGLALEELQNYQVQQDYVAEMAQENLTKATMSQSEREFLNRRGMPDLHQSSGPPSFPKPVIHHSLDNFPAAGRPPAAGTDSSSEVVNAMRDRIVQMEKHVETLKSKAKGAEEQALKSSSSAKDANKKLMLATKKFTRALEEKEEEYKSSLLRVGSELNESRATEAELRSKLASVANTSKSDNVNSSYQQELLTKVQSLHSELTNNQRRWNEEKRKLMSEQAAANQNLSGSHRNQIAELREEIAGLEDKVTDMNEQVRNVEKDKSLLNQKVADAERKKIHAVGEAEKFRSDVKTLQQSLQATQSLDLAQGDLYKDGESTIAALQATSDARIRTLNNKVEYLKAQLASEASLKDEYGKTIVELRQEKDEMAKHGRDKLKEMESLKEREIAEAQEQLRQSMDGPINEVSHLQSKVAALQAQLGDAMQDIAMSRKKEEAARGETSKERSRISSVQHELNMAQNELETAREEVAILKENSSNNSANEAMLRRLDNERQYLKNQLTSEVTCKNELQETLERTTRQLGEMKMAWKSESDSLTGKIRQEAERRDAIETELQSKNQSLQAEVKTQSAQLGELKSAYVKTRDQLRLDQASVENMRVTSQRLAEELKGAQDELVRTRQAEEDTNKRHSQNMQTVTSTVAQAEAARKLETERLQNELRSSLQKTSETQRMMVDLRDQMGLQQMAALKTRAAQTVGTAMMKWMNQQQAQAFSTWQRNLMMHKARDVAGQQIKQAVSATEEKMKEEREMACRMVMKKMAEEKEEAIRRMENEAAEHRKKLVKAAQEDIERAVGNERMRSNNLIKEQKLLWDQNMAQSLQNHKKAIEEMVEAHNNHQQSIKNGIAKDIERAVFEAERQFLVRQNELIAENDDRWKHMLSENEKRIAEDNKNAKKLMEEGFDKAMKGRERQFEGEKDILRQQFDLEMEQAVKKEEKRMLGKLTKAVAEESYKNQQEFNKEMKRMRDKMDGARELADENLKMEKKRWDESLDKMKIEWEEDIAAQHADRLRQIGDAEKDKRQKAVRLEAGKWQKALRETEDRIEAERLASFKKGVAERDITAQREVSDLKNAANMALEKVKQSAKDSLKQALSESASQLKLAREHAAREKEQAIAKGLKEANEDKIKAVDDAISVFSKNAEKKRTEAVEAAVSREQMATKRVQAELESVTQSWRRDQSELVDAKQQIDHLKVNSKSDLKSHLLAAEEAAVRARENFELQLADSLKRQKDTLDDVKTKEMSEQESKMVDEKENAIKETQKNANKEMEEALGALEAESEKLISSLEQAMAGLRRSKQDTENELAETKGMLEENEDTIYDLQQEAKMEKKGSSFALLRLTTGAMRQRINYLKMLDDKDKDLANEKVFMGREHDRSDEKRQQEIAVLEGILEACKQQRELMHETLVNHKRETLVEHKVQSGVISRELEQLAMERDAIEGQRESIMAQLKTMEDSLKDLEDQINIHSKTSTIQGGRVNVSHARKKRRLDEEFEQLLDNIENKREELSSVDAKLKEIMDGKEEAEDRMKGLERMLVEVLVEQQKKLLSILSQRPEDVARKMREDEKGGGH